VINAQELFKWALRTESSRRLLMEETKKIASQIAANGPVGVRLAKMAVDSGFNMDLWEAVC